MQSFTEDNPCALDPHVAERAEKIKADWTKATRYLRQKGVITIDGKRFEPERMVKLLKLQSRYVVPCVHVYDVDRYRFGMGPWRRTAQ